MEVVVPQGWMMEFQTFGFGEVAPQSWTDVLGRGEGFGEVVPQSWTDVLGRGEGFGEVVPQSWTNVPQGGGFGEVAPQGWTDVLGRGEDSGEVVLQGGGFGEDVPQEVVVPQGRTEVQTFGNGGSFREVVPQGGGFGEDVPQGSTEVQTFGNRGSFGEVVPQGSTEVLGCGEGFGEDVPRGRGFGEVIPQDGGFGEDIPQSWGEVLGWGEGFGEVVPQGWTEVRTLGQGGFGEVKLLVNNNKPHDCVAMKVLDTSRGEWVAESTAREIRVHGSLEAHPNVLRFLGQRRRGATAYLFLEYCSGGDLFDRLTPDVGLGDEVLARRYFGQLIAAVEYLHDVAGVAHRDIKAENILLDARDNVKLADFGLADALFRRKGDGVEERLFAWQCGSHMYMAPEVLVASAGQGRWYRARPVDVWACGVVLALMLTGVEPWGQASADSSWEYQDWLAGKTYLPPWSEIRPAPLCLLSGLLLHSPEERVSIADVKRHRWLAQKTHAAG